MTDLQEFYFIISPFITSVYCHYYHDNKVTDIKYILVLISTHICDYHTLYCMKTFGYNAYYFVSLMYHIF